MRNLIAIAAAVAALAVLAGCGPKPTKAEMETGPPPSAKAVRAYGGTPNTMNQGAAGGAPPPVSAPGTGVR